MSRAPTAEPVLELPPEMRVQLETARTLLFSATMSQVRAGTDPAIVTGVLMDCLAHLLAARPPASRAGDLQHVADTLRNRVDQVAAAMPPHPSMH